MTRTSNMAVEQKSLTKSKVQFQQMPNFRPVYAIPDVDTEGKIPKLFRSSRPDFLTLSEVKQFTSLGIKCIIDFRSASEYKRANGNKLLDVYYPTYTVQLPFWLHFKPHEKVVVKPVSVTTNNNMAGQADNFGRRHLLVDFFKMNYVWAIFTRASLLVRLYSMVYLFADLLLNTGFRHFVRFFARNVLNHSGLGGQYIDMVCYSKAQICAALKLLADPANLPAMINCAHGKDRTGIVSAMVLAVLGKSHEEIAENYAQSQNELEPIRGRVRQEIVDRFHMHETFTEASPAAMLEALHYINECYGDVPSYLEAIGFSHREQAQLRENLLS